MIRELLEAMPDPADSPTDDGDEPLAPNRPRSFGEQVIDDYRAHLADSHKSVDRTARLAARMYLGLFGLGIVTAIAGLVKGFLAHDVVGGLAMLTLAALSAFAFYALHAIRPLDSLQRHAILSCWLTASMNSYWTRLTRLSQLGSVEDEVKRATDDLIGDLTTLLEKQSGAPAGPAARVDLGTYRRTPGRVPQAWEMDGEPHPRSAQPIKSGIEG